VIRGYSPSFNLKAQNPTRPLSGGNCVSSVALNQRIMISYYGYQKFETYSPTTVLEPSFLVYAHAIDGFPLTTTVRSPSPGASSTLTTPTPTSDSTTHQPESNIALPTGDHSLAPSAIAGVVIGCIAAFALGLLAAIYWLSYRKKRSQSGAPSHKRWGKHETQLEHRQEQSDNLHPVGSSYPGQHELDDAGRHELDGPSRQELDGLSRQELGGLSRQELDGSGRQELAISNHMSWSKSLMPTAGSGNYGRR
jgi:hypothetical protein